MLSLHHVINDKEFMSIFGLDFRTIKEFISPRDFLGIAYILLNSLKLNFSHSQILGKTIL